MANGFKDGDTITDLVVQGKAHALEIENAKSLTFRNCRFLDCGQTNTSLYRSDTLRFENCVFDGSGLSEWEAHGVDCVLAKQCRNLFFYGCTFARGAHAGLEILDWAGGRLEVVGCRFERMGGSLLTLKRAREPFDALIEANRFTGAPTLAQAPAKHKVPHAVAQISNGRPGSGKSFVFRKNVCFDCGKGLLISSDGEQTASGGRYEENVFVRMEATAIEFQAVGGPGSLNDNLFRANKIFGSKQVLHLALPGAGPDLYGTKFEGNEIGGGAYFVSGGSPTSAEDANQRYPRVFSGNRTITVAPPTDGITPPPPPPPPPPPSPGEVPTITRLEPSVLVPRGEVRIFGTRIDKAVGAVFPIPGGLVRQQVTAFTGGVVAVVPGNVVSGKVFLRLSSEHRETNSLPFTVQGDAPPPPPPPPTPKTLEARVEALETRVAELEKENEWFEERVSRMAAERRGGE